MFDDGFIQRAQKILHTCEHYKLKIATAESCTGGLLAALFTEIPGSSQVFERGFVCYSNAAKIHSVGVDASLINMHGAVSEQTAIELARKTKKIANTAISIAITGIAGPSGGTATRPVGLVYIAVAVNNELKVEAQNFQGSRSEIRLQSVSRALAVLQMMLNNSFSDVA